MTGAPSSSVTVLPRRPTDLDALLECADEISKRLTAAKVGVIIVDVEIRRYGLEDRVTALARKLRFPIASKRAFPRINGRFAGVTDVQYRHLMVETTTREEKLRLGGIGLDYA
jgi:TPP-dependent 2-oxoacid decarboxylase